jgi:hypothetical protein
LVIAEDNTSNTVSNIVSKYFEDPIISNNKMFLSALEQFIGEFKKRQSIQTIPISLFSIRKLGILEVAVKYLKENHELTLHDIAYLLKRDDRTIWNTYHRASQKYQEKFIVNYDEQCLDINIFSDRNKAPLATLVNHLKVRGLSFKDISRVTNRSYKTIWLTHNKKDHNKNEHKKSDYNKSDSTTTKKLAK